MKKAIIAALAALLGTAVLPAQETGTVGAAADTVEFDCGCDEDVRIVEKGHVHLDFDIPFYHKIKKKDNHRDLVGAFGIGTSWTDSKAPLDFNPQNSLEFYCFFLDSHSFGRSTLSCGPGLTWRNFALTGNTAMSKTDAGEIVTGPFRDGASPKISKLRVFSLNLPLLYSCHLGGGFGFTLGPVVNLNASSSIVNKYSLDGKKQKDKYKGVHCNLVTVDAMFQLNMKYFSVYAKYSPMSLVDKKYWPEFQTWTIGVAL